MGVTLRADIPGQISPRELQRLVALAERVPAGGIVVELGSLYGRSSWHISQSCPPDATLFCIDPWEREEWIVNLVEMSQGAPPFGLDAFRQFTADCSNIVPIRGRSPDSLTGWHVPIDMYFDDSDHTNPTFKRNLEFWAPKVKPGGLLCGHDFTMRSPDVIVEVTALQQRLGTELVVVDTLWSLTLG